MERKAIGANKPGQRRNKGGPADKARRSLSADALLDPDKASREDHWCGCKGCTYCYLDLTHRFATFFEQPSVSTNVLQVKASTTSTGTASQVIVGSLPRCTKVLALATERRGLRGDPTQSRQESCLLARVLLT